MKTTLKLLKKANKIALFSHASPDPDTIGSTLALFTALKNMGKKVDLYCEDEIPENYNFLNDTINYNAGSFNYLDYDLLVAVDIASGHMLGKFEQDFMAHKNTLRLDHHTKGDLIACENLVEGYSACGILVYKLLKRFKVKISKEIATALYFAICGDTGIFRNNNTDSETFLIASKLLDAGAEMRRVYTEFFDKKTVPYLKLTSSILLNAEINDEFGFVIMSASMADYEKFNTSSEESIGNLPNTYLNCGYKLAVILKEKDDGVHCSLRSKFEYDCSLVAETFGGGGHKNASGCLIKKSLEEAKKDMETAVINYLKNLD